MNAPYRRFIAGAVCPACGKLDKTYIERSAAGRSRHCSHCQFEEQLKDDRVTDSWAPIRLTEPGKRSGQ
jgi:uncharacterized metal-binding protein (TIGR02443 family)